MRSTWSYFKWLNYFLFPWQRESGRVANKTAIRSLSGHGRSDGLMKAFVNLGTSLDINGLCWVQFLCLVLCNASLKRGRPRSWKDDQIVGSASFVRDAAIYGVVISVETVSTSLRWPKCWFWLSWAPPQHHLVLTHLPSLTIELSGRLKLALLIRTLISFSRSYLSFWSAKS